MGSKGKAPSGQENFGWVISMFYTRRNPAFIQNTPMASITKQEVEAFRSSKHISITRLGKI